MKKYLALILAVLMVVGDGAGHVGVGTGKAAEIPDAVRKAIEAQHDEIHSAMRSFEDVGPEYQELLAKERTYLDALNRIEQYETEKRIAAFEARMSEEVNGLDVIL